MRIYSEAFKCGIAGKVERGEPTDDIRGNETPVGRARKYGQEYVLLMRVKAGTMSEIDGLKVWRKENRG